MTTGKSISDALLHLYVDGELDAAETKRVLRAIEQDRDLKNRACQLQHLKALVKNQYPLKETLPTPQQPAGYSWQARAISLVLLCGGVLLGWFGHNVSSGNPMTRLADASASGNRANLPQPQTGKILLHIDDSDQSKLQALVDYTEALLQDGNRRNLKIEVVANAGGINLYRTGQGTTQKLQELTNEFSNLELFACANAISRLREKGIQLDLIPEAHTGTTALEHIVRRMQEGWRYHKI